MTTNQRKLRASGTTLDQLAKKADRATQERYEAQKANNVINPIVLAKLLSVDAEPGHEVKPQMIYNYIRKGKFTDHASAFEENNTQKKVIHLDEANTFAQGYLDRKLERESKDQDRIEAELNGTR